MNLFIDDQRVPPEGWEVARTVTDAIRILSSSPPEAISLDHDIAVNQSPLHTFSDENFSAVCQYLILMKNPPKLIFLHTASRYGCENMKSILSKTESKVVRISPMDYEQEIRKFIQKQERRKP